jgi:hypothetical protein
MAAPNSCEPCEGCIPGNMNKDWFMQAVIRVLCQILGALPGPGGAEPVPLPDEVKAYTFFTNAYQALGLVDAQLKISHLVITNNSDGDYAISFNNSDENYRVLANTYKVIDFDGANITVATDVYAKYVAAPSLGSVIFEAYYYA